MITYKRKGERPINQIKIAGTQILNIDLNQGWQITNIKFDNCCPSSYIDELVVTFEKIKMYDGQMTNETESTIMNPPKMVGWICPVCGRGLSPYTTVCSCKGWIEGD